jgi:hypothetical protein
MIGGKLKGAIELVNPTTDIIDDYARQLLAGFVSVVLERDLESLKASTSIDLSRRSGSWSAAGSCGSIRMA